MKSTELKGGRGEFLLMLLVAVAIIGVIAGILAPVLANKLDDAQIRSEMATLKSLRKDFEATYDALDYNNLNESSVASSGLPSGTTLTNFDVGTGIASRIYGPTVFVDPAGWVTKLARQRGISTYVIGASYGALIQNQYTAIAFNPYQVQRCLVVGPSGEVGQQRYLLISLMAPPYRALAFPTADPVQTFDSVWDQSWESTQAQAPASWSSLLTSAQFALWNTASSNNRTNASRLLVERIVQSKFALTLANNSQTDTAWVDIGPATNAIVSAPNSGTALSGSIPGFAGGVLAGRLIVVRRGANSSTAYEVQRFFMYSDVNLTIQ